MATSDLEIEGQGHKTIAFVALPIYTHIPNLKALTKIFFKLSRPKGNLCCCGGGVTVLNPKYPRLLSGDTIREIFKGDHNVAAAAARKLRRKERSTLSGTLNY